MIGWDTVLVAIGILFLLEGLVCLLAPTFVRKVMTQLLDYSNATFQRIGIGAALVGAAIIWIVA